MSSQEGQAPPGRPDLIPLVDLSQGDAAKLVDALTNVGLEAITARVDTGGRDGALTRSVFRVFVPRNDLPDARRVVAGVLPDLAPRGPSTPDTNSHGHLDASESEQWSRIVADLRSDGLDNVSIPEPPGVPEGFEPPEPGPIPRPNRLTLLSWAALIAGLALLLLSALLAWQGIVAFVGVACFVGGFVSLVARAGRGPGNQRDDDGAVV